MKTATKKILIYVSLISFISPILFGWMEKNTNWITDISTGESLLYRIIFAIIFGLLFLLIDFFVTKIKKQVQ